LVGWCLAEYVDGRETGVSVETGEPYRGRGFATLTAAAFVDQCRARGMAPYWDAWRSNAPSVAVAGKVGFRELMGYTVHLGRFA
jgi:GNAT superfamily N-acetyltransferase